MTRFGRNFARSMQDKVTQLRQRLERTTLRERILLSCLVIGASVYAPVYALERQSAESEAYILALEDQANARQTAQAARRITQGAADTAALEDMKTWGFTATNTAVAQLLIEDRLVATAAKTGLHNPVISTQSKLEEHGPTQWMFAEVQTDLRWEPTFNFIDAIGEWPEGFRIIAFRYEVMPSQGQMMAADGRSFDVGKITMGLSFPVNLTHQDGGDITGQTLQGTGR